MTDSVESKINKGKTIIAVANIIATIFFLIAYFYQRNIILLIPVILLLIATILEIIVFDRLKKRFRNNTSRNDAQNPS